MHDIAHFVPNTVPTYSE